MSEQTWFGIAALITASATAFAVVMTQYRKHVTWRDKRQARMNQAREAERLRCVQPAEPLESQSDMSATLENEADATLENEATGSLVSSLPCLGF
jgi:hypothetical protein